MEQWLDRLVPARFRTPAREAAGSPVSERKMAAPAPLVALGGAGAASWTQPSYAALAREGYRRNPVVHACIRAIARAVADAPRVAEEGGTRVSEHPVLALMARPNERQSGTAMLEAVVSHLLLAGDAYLRVLAVDGEPRALHVLRPDRVSPVLDRDGWVSAYDYRAGAGGSRRIAQRVELGDGPPPVLHLALFDPLSDHDGLPPLAAAAAAVDVHNAATRWNKALLDNSARPSGALVYRAEGNLSAEQLERLRGELEAGYSGAGRAGRPLVLEGGLDWKAMGYSPRDMDFAEARNGAARDIALAFGVPPMLLGIPGDNTYANYREASRAFWRDTALPLADRVLHDVGEGLNAWFGTALAMRANADAVPALSHEREALWRRVGAADFLSAAEKRGALGLAPVPQDEPMQRGEGAR